MNYENILPLLEQYPRGATLNFWEYVYTGDKKSLVLEIRDCVVTNFFREEEFVHPEYIAEYYGQEADPTNLCRYPGIRLVVETQHGPKVIHLNPLFMHCGLQQVQLQPPKETSTWNEMNLHNWKTP